MLNNLKIASMAAVLGFAGCGPVGPDYVPPSAVVSSSFVGAGSAELREAASIAWWRVLKEPLLNEFVSLGLRQNLDIAVALERIEAARAALRQRGVNSQVSGSVSAQSLRADNGFGPTQKNSATVDAAFVIDLFGGVRRGVEQGRAQLEQAGFDAATVRLGYLAEIVSSYVDARYFQNAAAIARQTVASQQRTLSIVQFRLEAGDATQLELQQAEQSLAQARAEIPVLVSGFEANVFRIATLLSEPAAPLLSRMQRGGRLPGPGRLGRVGVPADLVRNRPDVRAAERAVAAATAGIGIAEADLYPSLALGGSITISSTDTWTFGPAISFPVLNRGLLQARRDVAISQAKQAEIAWRAAVLDAVEDVQTSISQTRGLAGRVAALRRSREASAQLLTLARDSYENGASPVTDVIDAERALANARFSLVGAQRDFVLAWVQLQFSTGKGWLAN